MQEIYLISKCTYTYIFHKIDIIYSYLILREKFFSRDIHLVLMLLYIFTSILITCNMDIFVNKEKNMIKSTYKK